MDPVGPWSAYAASYNRLAGATGGFQSGSAGGAGDFVASHHHLAAATGNSGLGSHQPGGGVPSTTSQLLLQAAHTTASLAGQLGMSAAGPGTTASPFNPGGFLSPPPVGYDAVFSPLFHHANPKPAHYPSTLNVSQHRQALAQAQAAATKQSSVESELSSLRENYSTAHHQSLAASSGSFFEHQASSSSPSSSLAWSHQGNTQLPSPFGILPHETVVTSSPGPATSKSSTSSYENTFNAHFAAAQSLNHLNSQLSAAAEYNKNSGNYSDNSSKKANRSQSPLGTPVKPVASAASSVSASGPSFFHQAPSGTPFTGSETLASRGDCSSLSGNFSSNSKSQQQQQQQQQISSGSEFASGNKSFASSSSSSLHHQQQQQSCIVSTASSSSSSSSSSATSKDYRIPQPPSRSTNSSLFLNASSSSRSSSQAPEKQSSRNQNFVPPTSKASAHHTIQTKAQTKIYPELASSTEHSRRNESTLESSQSSPISFAMMDAAAHRQSLNYSGNAAASASCSSASGSTSKITSNPQRNSNSSNLQQSQFQHVMNQQAAASSSYHSRHYSGSVSTTDSSEYHHSGRSKGTAATAAPTETNYSNSSSSQNGPDCGVVVPRRPSPLQAHSQASPLGHVPSPAYPMYNSPLASMSSPSPLQQHSEQAGNQCSSGGAQRHSNPPSQQQVAPPSPLDVTVPRPSSQGGQVAYPSVITRALTSGEGSKSYGEGRSFERSQQQQQQQQQQQDFSQKQPGCWETGDSRQQAHHSRNTNKFQTSSGYGTGSGGIEMSQQVPAQQQAQQRAALGISERQQAYFDSSPGHQVTLQDLSSCRGDPMSIVKNLQTLQQQQSCQLQPNAEQTKSTSEERLQSNKSSSSSSSSVKRRKSSEKSHVGSTALNDLAGSAMAEYFTGRVPPPAHHNTNQQQQNGGYFDFERWNLPPPPPKMFGGGPGAFGSQSPLHHGSNFVGNPAHQHQSLMVHPHHHPPPPIPYFPAFQIHPGHHPHHPPHEFQPSVEITPLPFENPSSGSNSYNSGQETRDDQPKVIVPNIEEELGFLAEADTTTTVATSSASSSTVTNSASSSVTAMENKMPEKKSISSSNPSSGFMASYMKFLQGERDSSPPPANRGGRKATWARAKVYQPEPPKAAATTTTVAGTTTTTVTTASTAAVTTTSASSTESVATAISNGSSNSTTSNSATSVEKSKEVTTTKSKEISSRVYDPEDDPRYFPLPKSDAKRKSFADSDGEFDSSDGEKDKLVEKEKEKPKHKEKEEKKEKEKDKEKEKEEVKTKATTKQPKSTSKSSAKNSAPPPPTEFVASKAPEKPEKGKKGRGLKAGCGQAANKRKHDQEEVDPLFLPPRRETSRRKAKEKTSIKQFLDRQENLDEEFDADEPEFVDSDSDPAWTPAAKDSSDEDGAGRRRGNRRTRPLVSRKKSRLLSTSSAPGGSLEEDGYTSSESAEAPLHPPPNKKHHANHRSGASGNTKTSNSSGISKTGSANGSAKSGSGGSSAKAGSGNSKSTGSTGNSKSGGTSGTKSAIVGNSGSSKAGGGGSGGGSVVGSGRGRPRSVSITSPATNCIPSSGSSEESSGNSGCDSGDSIPFKSGEFVVMKSDLGEEYPPIWRIDGKTLLQKYEPFDQNGKTLYRNISTYSGWTPQNRHIYQQVPVKFRVQNRLETIVEFMREEMTLDDQELIDKSMKETAKYQDNFEVYIQTLISQALDSNFLTEIFQEQDDYFLSNVKTVDDVTEERKQRLLVVAQWKTGLQTSVGTWPCFNVISDLPADEKQDKLCAACDKSQVSVRVQMYGQPYNSTTLEGCQPDPKVASQKDFLLCSLCVGRVELYNKVAHQKYLMYIECAKRVAEKRSSDPYKDTTIILNELLADEAWLNQLFRSVRTSWAEIDKMEQQAQSKSV